MPLLAGTRSSLAHPFLLLVLCHHFPGGCTASFQVFDSGLPKGSPDKDVGPPFCCLWLCDYLPSLAVRGTEPEVAGGRILTLSKDHTPLFRCSIESSSLCTCAFSSAAAIPTPPRNPIVHSYSTCSQLLSLSQPASLGVLYFRSCSAVYGM